MLNGSHITHSFTEAVRMKDCAVLLAGSSCRWLSYRLIGWNFQADCEDLRMRQSFPIFLDVLSDGPFLGSKETSRLLSERDKEKLFRRIGLLLSGRLQDMREWVFLKKICGNLF